MKTFKQHIDEKWSEKYKKSIDCSNPKGFSQKAHCQGRKKNEETELNEKGRCWPGHRPVPGKKPYSPGSCVKEDGVVAAAPANVAGSGSVAGLGQPPGSKSGEPGVHPKKKSKTVIQPLQTRRVPKMV